MKNKENEIIENDINAIALDNIKYYFIGFSIAIGIFLILFVLWFININKTPKLISNPKTLNFISPKAFWTLSWIQFLPVETQDNYELWNAEIMPNWDSIMYNNQSIILWYDKQYHIWEKQIPKIDKSLYVAKKDSTENIKLSTLWKNIRYPWINTSTIKDREIDSLSINDILSNYQMNLDINNAELSVNKKWEIDLDNMTENKITNSQIEKSIKKEFNKLWLSLKSYWDIQIINNNEDKIIEVFYPLIINWKKVWNNHYDELSQKWIHLYVDTENKEIHYLDGYDFNTYKLSEYPITKTKDNILKTLKNNFSDINTSKKGDKNDIEMAKWEIIYLETKGMLIPSLIFQPQENSVEKTVIVPLI